MQALGANHEVSRDPGDGAALSGLPVKENFLRL